MIATNSYLTLLSLEVTILHPNTGEIWIKSLLSWVQITDAEIVSKKIADIPTANPFFYRVPTTGPEYGNPACSRVWMSCGKLTQRKFQSKVLTVLKDKLKIKQAPLTEKGCGGEVLENWEAQQTLLNFKVAVLWSPGI